MAQGNFTESVGKPLEVTFEASGLSFDDAERFAAAFKPSWEFDEAPFTDGGGVPASQINALAAGGIHADIPSPPDSRTVPPRTPPPRVETHEPEVSVIIDRSIVAAEIEAAPRLATAARPVGVPSFGASAAARAQPQRIAPVMSSRADESLGLPASLKKSNKGLFIGLGVAVVAAGLVFAVHGMMTPDSSDSAASTSTSTSATAPAPTAGATTPPVMPIPALAAAPPPARPASAAAAVVAAPAAPSPAPQPVQHSAPVPRPAPHAAAVHHAAPKNPPKPAAGGIVRDAPF